MTSEQMEIIDFFRALNILTRDLWILKNFEQFETLFLN